MTNGHPASPHPFLPPSTLFWPYWPHPRNSGGFEKRNSRFYSIKSESVLGQGKETSRWSQSWPPWAWRMGQEEDADYGSCLSFPLFWSGENQLPRATPSHWREGHLGEAVLTLILNPLSVPSPSPLPTIRLSYTRTPMRRSSCLSECQVSSSWFCPAWSAGCGPG